MTDDTTLPSLSPAEETVCFSESEKHELLRWATLLNKTSHIQGHYRLYDEKQDAFCCLGVYVVETVLAEEWIAFESKNLGLTTNLARKLGLYHTLYGLSLHAYFVSMNDVLHMTFPEISSTILYLLVNSTLPSSMTDWRSEWTRNSLTTENMLHEEKSALMAQESPSEFLWNYFC